MARLPVPGSDQGTWGNVLNEYLAQSLNSDGTLKSDVVTSSIIQDSSITQSKLAASNNPTAGQVLSFDGSTLTWVTSSGSAPDADATTKGLIQLAGDLTGTATAPAVASSAITESKLANTSISTAKLQDQSVTAGKIANTTITNAQISASAAIAQTKIANLTTDLAAKADASALSTKQDLDTDLTAIASLSPTNDDIIQRKSGAWTNRTMAQLKTDLSLTKNDVGLSNVPNTDATDRANHTGTQTASTISDFTEAAQDATAAAFAAGAHTGVNVTYDDSANSISLTTSAGNGIFNAIDYGVTGDGSDETTELQAWLDAIAVNGGVGIIPSGMTVKTTGVSYRANKPFELNLWGVTISPVAVGDTGPLLRIDPQNGGAGLEGYLREAGLVNGGTFTYGPGGSQAIGLQIRNADRIKVCDTRFSGLLVGVDLFADGNGEYVEHGIIDHIYTSGCETGLRMHGAGGASYSMDETWILNCGFGSATRGIDWGAGIHLYRGGVRQTTIWSGDGMTGAYLDGIGQSVTLEIGFEAIAGATTPIGVYLGPNATEWESANSKELHSTGFGTFGAFVDFDALGPTGFWCILNGRYVAFGAGGDLTSPIQVKSDGDVAYRIKIEQDGLIGWGDGTTSVADTVLYRGGANVLKTDDQIQALSLGLRTMVKAGIPADGDFSGVTMGDGVIAVDSSNNRLYVRVGGVWRYASLT